jgi:hypothetical protein
MKSTAAVAHSLRKPFSLEDVELPDLPTSEMELRSNRSSKLLPHDWAYSTRRDQFAGRASV